MYNWKRLFPYSDGESAKDISGPSSGKESGQQAPRLWIVEQSAHWLRGIDNAIRKSIPWISNLYVSFLFSIVCITLLSYLLLESAVNISRYTGIDEVYIGLIVIAVGTSVPDLFSSVIVARKGRPGMAINNAVGSNIFDILVGIGLPFAILAFMLKESIPVDRSDLFESLFWLLMSLVVLTSAFLFTKWRLKKATGYLLVLVYVAYILWEIAGAAAGSFN
jgi:Ca2+/Na+ antiporter